MWVNSFEDRRVHVRRKTRVMMGWLELGLIEFGGGASGCVKMREKKWD